VALLPQQLFQTDAVYLLAGDEVVVPKAGTPTHGLGHCFSSIYQRAVPGVACFSLALVSTNDRRALPVRLKQVVRTDAEQAANQAKTTAKTTNATPPTRKPGRPRGSKNKPQAAAPLSPELQRIHTLVQDLLQRIASLLPLTYLLVDGHVGNGPRLQLAPQCGVHLISKLRCDSAVYLPYAGPSQGRGPRRKYGAKLDYQQLPEECLPQSRRAGAVETRISHADLLPKEFGQLLNGVISEKRNRSTQKGAQVRLCSSDLPLGYDRRSDEYRLRCQIACTFRAAKQYGGLEDFLPITATGVSHAANLALCMVNLSAVLLTELRQPDPQGSVLALNAWYRGANYVTELINRLPEAPDDDLMAQLFHQMAQLGRIHPPEPQLTAA
jgi:hypothetical protein